MTEAAQRADFSRIRYAQVWEDADILVEALSIGPESNCLSIASAGDNALALLAQNPKKVVAIDLNPAQLHCLALRVAAFRKLDHPELLELIGSRPSQRRQKLYQACRESMDTNARTFWDGHPEEIARGIGHAGKFEAYFALFRHRMIPLIHPRSRVEALLEAKGAADRQLFYTRTWNNRRWRALFKLFFSRFIMGRLGRDPAFFNYVEGSVAENILKRTRYALTELEPDKNPYLQWILCGEHRSALPFYLRAENFENIRRNLDRIEWQLCTVEEFVERVGDERFHAYNLSDIFEYMSESNMEAILQALLRISAPGARIAYWNMLAPRSRPENMRDHIHPLNTLGADLFAQDKAFFYSRFIVEEVMP
jgi:S-adenosylmethionine-diacylglycerol 3-amino-3-carboxypropyl transferase